MKENDEVQLLLLTLTAVVQDAGGEVRVSAASAQEVLEDGLGLNFNVLEDDTLVLRVVEVEDE